MLQLTTACAQTPTQNETKGTNMLPKAFDKQPTYKLKIHGQSNKFQLFFNGSQVYEDYTTTTSNITYPINDLITDGKNELKIKLFASKSMEYHFKDNAFLHISLIVENDKGKEMTLSTLSYVQKDKDRFQESTLAGHYSIDEGLKKVKLGDLVVTPVRTDTFTMSQTEKVNGLYITQDITLPTPFPRWKFLDSDDILNKPFDELTMDEYMKLKSSPKIQALYDAYRKIHTGLKNKDINSFTDMFGERFREADIAWYNPSGYNKNDLTKDLQRMVNDSKWELKKFDEKNQYFFVEDSDKLAYVRKIIRFKKKNTKLYTNYNMKFRWDEKNQKWILTR